MTPRDAAPAVLPAPVLGPPPAPRVPVPRRWTLPNGLRVVAAPRRELPQVVLRLAFPAGAALDPPGRPGTAYLAARLLMEGTQGLDAEALAARLDYLGASVHASAGHDFTEVEALLLSETLEEGLALMAEVATRPALPADELERVRAEALDALVARLDEPSNVAEDRAALEVFGPEHPYGHPAFGTREGLAALSRDELAAFHARCYRPDGAFLVAAGDFDPEELDALLREAFRDWSGAVPPRPRFPLPERPAALGRTVVVPWEDAAQSEIRLLGPGLPRSSAAWVEATVANYVLGGSTITGRLGANLREDKGWTYGARSSFSAGVDPGGWTAEVAVDVEVTADALREMRAEMTRMVEEPVPADELRRAKDAMILSLPRAFENAARTAGRLATLEAFGLAGDYWERFAARVEAVTADDVRRVAREHFAPGRSVTVVVGGGTDAAGGG